MMYEICKKIAFDNNWIFKYGRSDFQNLFDEDEQKGVSHLFLDPVDIEKQRGDSGTVEGKSYSGAFMLVFSSDIDEESYEFRYENYIKPILDNQIKIIEEALICQYEATIDTWRTVEIINILDYNFDGVHVTYKISILEE